MVRCFICTSPGQQCDFCRHIGPMFVISPRLGLPPPSPNSSMSLTVTVDTLPPLPPVPFVAQYGKCINCCLSNDLANPCDSLGKTVCSNCDAKQYDCVRWCYSSVSSEVELLPLYYLHDLNSPMPSLPTTPMATVSQPPLPVATSAPKRTRRQACLPCHEAKTRCDGGQPCPRCKRLEHECLPVGEREKKKRKKKQEKVYGATETELNNL